MTRSVLCTCSAHTRARAFKMKKGAKKKRFFHSLSSREQTGCSYLLCILGNRASEWPGIEVKSHMVGHRCTFRTLCPGRKKQETPRWCTLVCEVHTSYTNQHILMGNRVLSSSRRERRKNFPLQISRVNSGVRGQGSSLSTMRWIVDARGSWVIAA